jgi:hypothetical protein
MQLSDELKKPEYRFGTYAERLAKLRAKTTKVIGAIRGDNLRDVVAILASGLQYRLDNAPDSPLRTALLVGFRYMGLQEYGFNLAEPKVHGMLQMAVHEGLVTADEYAEFLQLATYDKPLYPTVTTRDIVKHFEPHLTDVGQWRVIEQVATKQLRLQLRKDLPEPSSVTIEMRESNDNQTWSAWRRVAQFSGVHEAGNYYQAIPFNGLQRQVRWRGTEYALDADVTVV